MTPDRVARSLRLDPEVDALVAEAAHAARRSVNAEIEHRLAASFTDPPTELLGVGRPVELGDPPPGQDQCAHPKASERKLAYGVFCGLCGAKLR